MRLLVNAPYDLGNNDGIAHYILNLVPELAALCEVTALTPSPELLVPGIRAVRIPKWTTSRYGRLLWTTVFVRHLCRDCDVVFCPTSEAPLRCPAPYIATVHDLTPLVLRHLYRPRKKLPILPALYTLRWASAIIADSHNTRRDLIRWRVVDTRRIHVVPLAPGVRPGAQASSPALPRPFVLYVGGYGPNKNLHRLLRAFARLDGATDLRLVVIGWGESQSVVEAKKLVKSLNLGERVHLLANCFSDAELSAFYGGCEAFVYPSLHEGFGLPVLEALAHGVPTACSNSSSLTAVAGEAALYFDPLSESDMANVMRRVLCDERLRCHLGVAARIRAGEFAWAETAASIRRVAETLSATLGRARLEP